MTTVSHFDIETDVSSSVFSFHERKTRSVQPTYFSTRFYSFCGVYPFIRLTDGELLMPESGDEDRVSLNDGGFERESSVNCRFSRRVAVLMGTEYVIPVKGEEARTAPPLLQSININTPLGIVSYNYLVESSSREHKQIQQFFVSRANDTRKNHTFLYPGLSQHQQTTHSSPHISWMDTKWKNFGTCGHGKREHLFFFYYQLGKSLMSN